MKCPKCEYEHGGYWEKEQYKERQGDEGDFFVLPIQMRRDSLGYYRDRDEEKVFGCPKCGILFMRRRV